MVTLGARDGRSANGRLPVPEPGRHAAEAFVSAHLGHLSERRGPRGPLSSPAFRGGQGAAEAALARFDVTGYRAGQEVVYPQRHRHGPVLWPWVRHGLLTLGRLWRHVADGPPDDVAAFRAALLAEEVGRLHYARLALAGGPPRADTAKATDPGGPEERRSALAGWNRRMACLGLPLDELVEDGWLPLVARDWLAHQWVATGHDPAVGAELLARHLLDGSPARSRLDWQLAQARAGDPTVVSRWQIERLAPGLCADCALVTACPLDHEVPGLTAAATHRATVPGEGTTAIPSSSSGQPLAPPPTLPPGVHPLAHLGPSATVTAADHPASGPAPEAVWVTAESLGDGDPALAANPHLPAVFVFDEPLLGRLRPAPKRLAFLVETLADLATRREVEVWLGRPTQVLAGRPLAATFTPVPGWHRRAAVLTLAEVHPWPWLFRETQASRSYSPGVGVGAGASEPTDSTTGRDSGALV